MKTLFFSIAWLYTSLLAISSNPEGSYKALDVRLKVYINICVLLASLSTPIELDSKAR